MKKFFLNLFVLTGLVLSTACSSDDDGGNGGGASDELVVTIDGQTITFNSIIVDEDTFTDDGDTYTELDVTATINGDSTRVIQFGLEAGDTGADAVYYFEYTVEGETYFYGFDNSFSSVVSINDGSRLTMTFSGTLYGYDSESEEPVELMLQNGTIDVVY
ncbi:hypothetical protein [Psychroserpens algicola]|uniref:hypothetical protein n=1 Tax=Psychroserpens algicola TaxID=1719034 RepID=UPI001952A379|nr:hypothetical protein [Psychroserpens algicola]